MYPNRGGKDNAGRVGKGLQHPVLQPKGNMRPGQVAGAKIAITKGQLTERDQIEQLVDRFTQTYNYKSYAEMDRQYNCHAIEDAIKESHNRLVEALRRQHREYKEKTLAHRELMLAELRQFHGVISKLLRQDVPKLVEIYRAQANSNTTANQSDNQSGRGQGSGETIFSSLPSLKDPNEDKDPEGPAAAPPKK